MIVQSRSRKGAWIEIVTWKEVTNSDIVAPVRERGLKLHSFFTTHTNRSVAPVRERGLKFMRYVATITPVLSRSRKGAWIEIPSTFSINVAE